MGFSINAIVLLLRRTRQKAHLGSKKGLQIYLMTYFWEEEGRIWLSHQVEMTASQTLVRIKPRILEGRTEICFVFLESSDLSDSSEPGRSPGAPPAGLPPQHIFPSLQQHLPASDPGDDQRTRTESLQPAPSLRSRPLSILQT